MVPGSDRAVPTPIGRRGTPSPSAIRATESKSQADRRGTASVTRTSGPTREAPAGRVAPDRGSADRTLVGDLPARPSPGVTRRDVLAGAGGAGLSQITGDTLGGVNLSERPNVTSIRGNTTVIDNSINTINIDNSVNYITNVTNANTCWQPNGWGQPVWGPGACWNSWGCNDGWSFGIGFGSGNFTLGLWFGSGGAPLCSSWCNPWWNGWSTSVAVNCPPSWSWCRPCWSPCGPWWSNYWSWNGVPTNWCTPVFPWTPVVAVPSVTYVNYVTTWAPAVVEVPVAVAPAVTVLPSTSSGFSTVPLPQPADLPSAAESEAWQLLADGFPRSAATSFAAVHDANPGNLRALAGYAVALAELEDIPGAANAIRQVLASDPSVLSILPLGPRLSERMRLLEGSAQVASRQAGVAPDALTLLAAWRTALGDYTGADFAVLSAQQAGDQSLATARLRAWLSSRLTARL